jgi:hypothetical protein
VNFNLQFDHVGCNLLRAILQSKLQYSQQYCNNQGNRTTGLTVMYLFVKLAYCICTSALTFLSFHIFGSFNAMKTKIPRSIQCNNMSLFIAIVLALLVDVNIIAIYELWKSSEFVYYQITQLSEQKSRLAIPFAEHNFGRFGRNFSCSNRYQKHYLECHLRACIFKYASFITVSHLYQATNVGLIFVVHSSRRWDYRFQIKIKEFNA